MSRPTLYVAITNHGYGHVVRASSIAAQIQQNFPDILLIMVTAAPHWLLSSYIMGDFIHRPRAFDVGVIQPDSLNMDRDATLIKLKEIQQKQNSIIASEVSFIRQNKVDLILADIPPLAAPIGRAAGIPCWMLSNFGWDFIYRDWGGEFIKIADWISDCFGMCDQLFRLPLYEPMSAFPHITDVGLTGGNPRYDLDKLREIFKIYTPQEKTLMLTFGGLNLAEIPYKNVLNFPDFNFITFDPNAPDLPNLVNIRKPGKYSLDILSVTENFIRPVDLMPLCGRIISKPGYSTFAETLKLELPLVSLSRSGFAESTYLLEGMQDLSLIHI